MGDTSTAVNASWRSTWQQTLCNKHFATNTLDYRCLHIFHLVKGEWQIFTANVYQGNFNSFQLCIFELIIVNLNSG